MGVVVMGVVMGVVVMGVVIGVVVMGVVIEVLLLQAHFKNIIRSAQSHVRRNELWKKLLYGGMSSEVC